MDENYAQLLKPTRRRLSTRPLLGALQESESDRARVLYAAAFRRLQRKTQVFPLEQNAAVRSRLTHSLEVAHVGRYITTSMIEKLRKDSRFGTMGLGADESLALVNIVDTACLLHDIGNPPFGHFGEAAISNWAASYLSKKFPKQPKKRSFYSDFVNFDGNPQGLRIITSISGVDGFGMNLTAAQVASTIKYPCSSDERASANPLTKKCGYFHSEQGAVDWVKSHFGLGKHVRFPLAFIMEAADDISYCLSDIEDGIEKGYTTHDQFYSSVREFLRSNGGSTKALDEILKKAKDQEHVVEPTIMARTSLIRQLVDLAASAYVAKHRDIFSGKTRRLLDEDSEPYRLLKAIRETVQQQLYGRRPSVELELAGHTAIQGILSKFEIVLSLSVDDFDALNSPHPPTRLVEAQRIFSLLPKKYFQAYVRARSSGADEMYCRIELVTDFVAGMTDVFALSTYQMLHGIR